MKAIFSLGKYLFAIPFAIFGVMHLMNADAMAGMAPIGGSFMVYLTGVALIAAAVSIIMGKMDKLATALLALLLILFAVLVQAVGLSNATEEMAPVFMSGLLKDLALAGAALLYAGNLSKDNSVIG